MKCRLGRILARLFFEGNPSPKLPLIKKRKKEKKSVTVGEIDKINLSNYSTSDFIFNGSQKFVIL